MREMLRELEQGPDGGLGRLLADCADGDARAWRRLLAAVRREAFRAGYWRYRLSLDDAEDLAQAVQLRVWESLGTLREAAAFPVWLRQLIHRTAIDELRRRRPQLSLEALADEAEPRLSASESGDPFDRAALRADLDRALRRLPPRYREPLELHLLHELPQEEVGRRLGRSRSTIATQVERGLRRLERTLSPAVAAGV